jgi:hypothetical protein
MPSSDASRSDDAVRFRVLAPHEPPVEGLSTITTDLGAFFVIVGRVGRDEALLLLLIRALRQRRGERGLRLQDLAWVLRTSEGGVARWLDRLTHHGLLVYQVEEGNGVETLTVEVAAEEAASAWVVRSHELPSHWFVQTLPLLGRTTFSVFLFLLSRDTHEGLARIDDIVTNVQLRGRLHAHWHLRKLHAHALLAPHPSNGSLVVRDPSPPTAAQRLRLRLLALPFLQRARKQLVRLVLAVLVLLALLVLAAHVPHLLFR